MENIILKYLNNEASDEEKQKLSEWLKEGNNKKKFLDMCNIWLACGAIRISEDEINNAFGRLTANIKHYEKQHRTSAAISWQKVTTAAAIIVFLFFAAGFFFGKYFGIDDRLMIVNNVTIGPEEKKTITLPDGTIAWLNSNSTIIYPQEFTEKERLIKLNGEAFFDVSKDPDKPFIVESGDIKIKVLGTEFDIKNYKDQKKTETSLLSGKVEISIEGIGQRIELEPSQRITFNKESKTFDIRNFDIASQTIWINDELIFSDERLDDILKKIGYWYGTEVVYEEGLNTEQKLSFIVRNESKEELFKIISLIVPIEYQISEDKIIVKTR